MNALGINDLITRSSLYIALLAAWVAMLGSLYFSEVLGYLPCVLCWYQRILMYPLAGIIAIGILRQDINLPYYILPFSLFGQGVATYHYLIQKTQIFGAPTACQAGIPCTTAWINWGGFITIPFLAMTAFFIITILALLAITTGQPELDEDKSIHQWITAGIIVLVIAAFVVLAQRYERQQAALSLTEVAGGELSPATVEPSAAQQPGGETADGDAADDETGAVTAQGAQLYAESCGLCHGADGEGLPNLGPSLTDSEVIQSYSSDEALDYIRAGVALDDPDNSTGLVMPPSGGRSDFTDEQILAIIEYLRRP